MAVLEQQGAGAAGEVHHTVQPLLGPGLRFLAVQRDDGGEDVGNLLWRVELARLLAGPGGKLADQVPAVWRSEQSSDLVGCAVAHRF